MEGLTVGVSKLFRERLLYRVSPIALITQRLDESVAIRDLLFNDLFDLCDNPRLCKEMMDLLGPEPSNIKKLFLNHRKRSKRPQLELFFTEPFPTKGIEEVFRRLILHANEGTDGFVIPGTDSFRPVE